MRWSLGRERCKNGINFNPADVVAAAAAAVVVVAVVGAVVFWLLVPLNNHVQKCAPPPVH